MAGSPYGQPRETCLWRGAGARPSAPGDLLRCGRATPIRATCGVPKQPWLLRPAETRSSHGAPFFSCSMETPFATSGRLVLQPSRVWVRRSYSLMAFADASRLASASGIRTPGEERTPICPSTALMTAGLGSANRASTRGQQCRRAFTSRLRRRRAPRRSSTQSAPLRHWPMPRSRRVRPSASMGPKTGHPRRGRRSPRARQPAAAACRCRSLRRLT